MFCNCFFSFVQKYSTELEALASKWVENCKFEHPDVQQHPEYAGTGQNLAVTGGSALNVTFMVENWHSEVAYYHYDNNDCDPKKTVWPLHASE